MLYRYNHPMVVHGHVDLTLFQMYLAIAALYLAC